jgi:hypothetical protein
MKKALGFILAAVLVASLSAPAGAQVVKGIDCCVACPVGNITLNLEGLEATVNVQALALQLNAKTGLYEGPGTAEVLGPEASGFALLARDPLASFAVGFGVGPAGERYISSLHVDGVAVGSGNRFSIDGVGVGAAEALCYESRVTAVLVIDRGAGFIKKSWGTIKAGAR